MVPAVRVLARAHTHRAESGEGCECLFFKVVKNTGVRSLTGLLGVRQKGGPPLRERNHVRINLTHINVTIGIRAQAERFGT